MLPISPHAGAVMMLCPENGFAVEQAVYQIGVVFSAKPVALVVEKPPPGSARPGRS